MVFNLSRLIFRSKQPSFFFLFGGIDLAEYLTFHVSHLVILYRYALLIKFIKFVLLLKCNYSNSWFSFLPLSFQSPFPRKKQTNDYKFITISQK